MGRDFEDWRGAFEFFEGVWSRADFRSFREPNPLWLGEELFPSVWDAPHQNRSGVWSLCSGDGPLSFWVGRFVGEPVLQHISDVKFHFVLRSEMWQWIMSKLTKVQLDFLKSALRRASMRWGPIWKTKVAARRAYKGPKKRQKYEYKCNECQKHHPSGKVQVHHVVPVGGLRDAESLLGYVERLLCEQDELRLLCLDCHKGMK